jgi:hypothetical protein
VTAVAGALSPRDPHLTVRHRSEQRKPPKGFQVCKTGALEVDLKPITKEGFQRRISKTPFDPRD